MGEGLAMTMLSEAFNPPRVTMVILPIGVVCSWPASQPLQFGSALSITHCKVSIFCNTAGDQKYWLLYRFTSSYITGTKAKGLCVMR